MLFTWFSFLSSRILLPLFSWITLDLYGSLFQMLVGPSRDPLVRPFNLISDNALLLWNGKGVIVFKDELFTAKEIQWFTFRLYKNNHNILNMDLYSLVPRERPRFKSYGVFSWNSKSGFSNPKSGCFFLFRLDYQSLLEKRARAWPRERAKSSQLSYGHLRIDATFWYLNFVSSDSISTLAMIFVDLFFF